MGEKKMRQRKGRWQTSKGGIWSKEGEEEKEG